MGQFSLLAVLAAFLISGAVIFNANRSADNADQKVWEHQYHVLARDLATSGMAAAVREMTDGFVANTTWDGGFAGSLGQSDIAYGGGTYTITAAAANPGPTACPLLTSTEYTKAMTDAGGDAFVPQGDVITITATGAIQGDAGGDIDQSHQLRACYVKADYGLFSPPAFNFGFISDEDFTFNGGPVIQAYVEGDGHIHSNGDMALGPQVEIDGHATYTGTGDVHRNTTVSSHGGGPTIPLELFDAIDFAASNNIPSLCTTDQNACRYDAGFTATGDMTISPPASDPNHRETDPFIWYIDGDFTLSGGDHITVPQYTTIVVSGNISISGGSAVTVTGQTAQDYCGCNHPTEEQSRQWVGSQLFNNDESPLAWYAGTVVKPDPADETTWYSAGGNTTISGTPGVVGNFYVNGDVELNGGGTGNNTIGSFASADGNITANGGGNGNNFWFLDVADENVVDGVKLPGKQIVRLALAEWTDPVLDTL